MWQNEEKDGVVEAGGNTGHRGLVFAPANTPAGGHIQSIDRSGDALTTIVDTFLDTRIHSFNQLVSVSGLAWNDTNLRGKDRARFADKMYIGMRAHFNRVHLERATAKATEKYSRFQGLMISVQERCKRGGAHKKIELAISEKLGIVPEQYIYRLYNPMMQYSSFAKLELNIQGNMQTVYVLQQGRGHGSQIIYVVKTGPWLLESALLRLKRLLRRDIDINNVMDCRQALREIDRALLDANQPVITRNYSVENGFDYVAAIEEIAQHGMDLASIHNREARRR